MADFDPHTLQCSSCGKTIPVAGDVCPHCHRDKAADKAGHAYDAAVQARSGTAILIGLLAGAATAVGGYLAWGGGGATLGILGVLIGGVVAYAVLPMPPAPKVSAKPLAPVVTVANQAQPATSPEAVDKVRKLHELHLSGALTESEYEAAKKRLLGI